MVKSGWSDASVVIRSLMSSEGNNKSGLMKQAAYWFVLVSVLNKEESKQLLMCLALLLSIFWCYKNNQSNQSNSLAQCL